MKVFISWSGERSRRVAELFNWWLPSIIQAVKPWVSSNHIDGGSVWFSEISSQLAETTTGIICLTKSNKDKPWILFESGALAKGLAQNRVCTFLIDLESTDIKDPLAQFNHTTFDKTSLLKLVRSINATLKDHKLSDDILTRTFNTFWQQFEDEFNKIITDTPDEDIKIERDDDDILKEILTSVRGMEHRIRKIENNDNNSYIEGNKDFKYKVYINKNKDTAGDYDKAMKTLKMIYPEISKYRVSSEVLYNGVRYDYLITIHSTTGIEDSYIHATFEKEGYTIHKIMPFFMSQLYEL